MTMKKRSLLIIFSILLLACSNLYGQDYYMYIDGKKRDYKVSTNKILVQQSNSILDSAKIRNSLQRMSVNARKITKLPHNEFMIIDLGNVSKENVVNLIEQWNVAEQDAYLSPIISGDDNFEMGIVSNQIIVGLKCSNDYSVLLQKIKSYNVKEIQMFDFDDKTYLITLSNLKKKKSLQIANELYESDLFDYAEPNMFHFVQRMTYDTHYNSQWALHSSTAGINAPQAWAITTWSKKSRLR